MSETVTISKETFNKLTQSAAAYAHSDLAGKVRELIKKWREESSKAPIRLARYGSKDDLEHCADELEAVLARRDEQVEHRVWIIYSEICSSRPWGAICECGEWRACFETEWEAQDQSEKHKERVNEKSS